MKQKKISMIAAMTKDRIIGKENTMPWHLPADFIWFKQQTLGKAVIMGRKTFESIGKALPNRRNIVITREANLPYQDIEVANSIESALNLIADDEEIMIIGGGSVYEACLPLANKLYLTFIDAEIKGDTVFPDWGSKWKTVFSEHYLADEKNLHNMEFVILER